MWGIIVEDNHCEEKCVYPTINGNTVFGTDAYSKDTLRHWFKAVAMLSDTQIDELFSTIPADAWHEPVAQDKFGGNIWGWQSYRSDYPMNEDEDEE
jgi:hypothetical protein